MSSLIVSEEDKKMEAEETPFENVLDYINRVLSAVLPIPLILINLLVIWLSIYKVRPSLSRSFSLHMSIPSLAYSFYLLVWWILSFLNLDQDFSFRTKLNNVSFMDYFTDYVYWWCTYQYRMLAILIIVLTYLSFARPMFYQKVSQDWLAEIQFTDFNKTKHFQADLDPLRTRPHCIHLGRFCSHKNRKPAGLEIF
ncbi:hypothetical protein L596_012024 [Steinernema carpocapsae]|uniref:Uncharacterized protein n=1 Tax=Steinernema carpocapsae TaxID=34508 RepID=A0A4U5NVV1_STECR|nr:hypothetical protein L596_012024 [Steinernema carpocapsae]